MNLVHCQHEGFFHAVLYRHVCAHILAMSIYIYTLHTHVLQIRVQLLKEKVKGEEEKKNSFNKIKTTVHFICGFMLSVQFKLCY